MTKSLLTDKRLILYLYVALRLTLLLVYQPFNLNGVERGLTTFGDFQTYYNFASLSSEGKLPYRDYWYEFPPVFPAVSLATYALTGNFTAYATLLGLLMTVFDGANLLLIQQLTRRLHGEATSVAIGWIYLVLAAPIILTFWTFEPLVTCFVLLSLLWLVDRQDTRSAVSTALGALTKLFPLALIAVTLRFRPLRQAIRYAAISVVIFIIGIAILFASGNYALPSLTAQFNKASYETVWALIDGNYKTGNFGPVADRLDPAKAYELTGYPAVIPSWLRLVVFGGLGLFIYARTRRFDARGVVAFGSITLILFFLWAQGWSPQWQITIIPLILLNFPTRDGVLGCIALSFVSFVEFPVLFMRTAETGGAIAGSQLPLFAVVVIARTVLLAAVAFGLYRILVRPVPEAITS